MMAEIPKLIIDYLERKVRVWEDAEVRTVSPPPISLPHSYAREIIKASKKEG